MVSSNEIADVEVLSRWSMQRAKRLATLQRVSGLSQEAVAEQTGIPKVTLQRVFSGKSVPTAERLTLTLDAIGATMADLFEERSEAAIVDIDVYDIEVAAGAGRFAFDEASPVGSWPLPATWVESNFGRDRDIRIVRVSGDSQEPELRDGDLVAIDLGATALREGMHVVRLGETLLIKRLQLEGAAVRLKSANQAYNDVVVDLSGGGDQFAVVGKALCAVKLL